MSKFFHRIGTICHKFDIDIILHKVIMNFQQVGVISVVFKRGKHVAITKKTQSVQKGQIEAIFNEVLSIPATLYQDKKSLKYQEKRAELIVNSVGEKKLKRLGITLFNISDFLNKNVKEKSMEIPVKGCSDAKAKFFFTIKIHHKGQIEESKIGEVDSDDDTSQNSEDKHDLDLSDYRSKSPISRTQNKTENEKDQQQANLKTLNKSQPNTPLQKEINNISQQKKQEEKNMENRLNISTPANNKLGPNIIDPGDKFKGLTEKKDNFLLFEQPQETQIQNSLLKENKELKQKNDELERELIKTKDICEKLKVEKDNYIKMLDTSKNDTKKNNIFDQKSDKELKIFKERIVTLEQELNVLNIEKEEYLRNLEEMQLMNENLMSKIEANQANVHLDNGAYEELNIQLKQAQQTIRELEKKNLILNQENKLLNQKEANGNSKQIQNEEKDKKIKELEDIIKRNEQDIELYKNIGKGKSKEEILQLNNHIKELESKIKQLELDHKSKVKDLEDENSNLRKEIEKLNTQNNILNIKNEKEIARLQIENDELLKQLKELQNKYSLSRSDTREVEQLKAKNIRLEDMLKKYDKELAEAKYGWATSETEKEMLQQQITEYEKIINEKMLEIQKIEDQLVMTKKNLGEALNVAFEFGGSELLDRIEEKVTFAEFM